MPVRGGVKRQPRLSRRGVRRQVIKFWADEDIVRQVTEIAEEKGVSCAYITTLLFERAWQRLMKGVR